MEYNKVTESEVNGMRRPRRPHRNGCNIGFILAVCAFVGAAVCLAIFSAKCLLFIIAVALIVVGILLLKL